MTDKSETGTLTRPMRITQHSWPNGTPPQVSVFCWSYNHAAYIRQSIESILMQETTFPVEIIIHDDASTDGTVGIIKEYERQYPRLFRNILQLENQMSQGKSVMTSMYTAPRGKYISLTLGDDYWTFPGKLALQYRVMEDQPAVSLCFHPVTVHHTYDPALDYTSNRGEPTRQGLGDILKRNMATCSMFWRTSLMRQQPAWIPHNCFSMDWALQMHLADLGAVHMVERVMAVYRRNPGGLTHGRRAEDPDILDRTLCLLEAFNRHTRLRHAPTIYRKMFDETLAASLHYQRRPSFAMMLRIFTHCLLCLWKCSPPRPWGPFLHALLSAMGATPAYFRLNRLRHKLTGIARTPGNS